MYTNIGQIYYKRGGLIMPVGICNDWNVKVYKGKYGSYNHDVIAIKLESKLIKEAKLSLNVK